MVELNLNQVMKKIIYILLLTSIFTSCVPYKNIVYVQGEIDGQAASIEDYKVQKRDVLFIDISSSNDVIQKLFSSTQPKSSGARSSSENLYFRGYTVDEEGNIELPIIGKMQVEGMNYDQIKQNIKQALLKNQFKTLDDIFIRVKLAGIPYTIMGEVKKPLTGVLYKEKANLFDAISNAGDITLVGDRKKVVVMREEQGKRIKKILDLTNANVVNSPYFHIRPNDIIYVKPLRQKTLGTGDTFAKTINTTITALSLITSIFLLTRLYK